MDFSADHIGFVAAAYGLTFAVLAGLILMVLADHRAQRTALERLGGTGDAPRRRKAIDAREPAT